MLARKLKACYVDRVDTRYPDLIVLGDAEFLIVYCNCWNYFIGSSS